MSKVGVIAKLTTVEGKRDEVVQILASQGVPVADDEPGTEIYAAHVDSGDDVTIWYYELYTDEAALAAHGKNPAMKDVGAALGGLLAGRPEIHVLSPFAAKGLEL